MTVEIQLTTAQANATIFDLYSNVDGFIVPFETNIPVASLTVPYQTSLVPDNTIIIRVQSVSPLCTNFIDILLTTTTTSTSSTTTTTTTAATIGCSETANSGGVGVTEYTVGLESSGGSIILDFNAQSVPDKLEILHNGVKVATSGMTGTNEGPFDDLYGDPLVPTSQQAADTTQFIGISKGTIPNRRAIFLSDTGISSVTGTKQQMIWWIYSAGDYAVDSNVMFRVTGPSGTAWDFDRLCEPEETTTTTTTSTSTTTTTSSSTTTTTTTNSPELQIGSISSQSHGSNACFETLDTVVWIDTLIIDFQISPGDIIYIDSGGTTEFVGDTNFYQIDIAAGENPVSAEVNALGVVGSVVTSC